VHLPSVSEAELKWLYRNALALVSASREDFGLTPIEANHEGTPAILVQGGGFLETLKAGVNGEFFAMASVDACASALMHFNPKKYDARLIEAHARRFGIEQHMLRLRQLIDGTVGARADWN
jgi:glycosyltransferase involved in cell wall biosynthesis